MSTQPQFKFSLYDDAGNGIEVSLPAKFVVCYVCEGRGTHVNRAIDGNGISPEEFREDPDFEESYFRGDYDVQCEKCHGARVISDVDEERLTEKQREQLDAHYEAEEESARADYSERWLRMAETGEHW